MTGWILWCTVVDGWTTCVLAQWIDGMSAFAAREWASQVSGVPAQDLVIVKCWEEWK